MARRKNKKNAAGTLINASPQTQSGLFKIPPELRNNIYELALKGVTVQAPMNRAPRLLLVCKTIYAEALQVYYTNYVFRFSALSAIQGWIRTISVASLRSLRHLEFGSRSFNLRNTNIKGVKQTSSSEEVAHVVLARMDHMLQAKGVTLDVGAVKVDHLGRYYTWQIDEAGKKIVVDVGSFWDSDIEPTWEEEVDNAIMEEFNAALYDGY